MASAENKSGAGKAADSLRLVATAARRAADRLGRASIAQKNAALAAMAKKMRERRDEIVWANRRDLEAARRAGLPEKLVARLGFGEAKINARIEALRRIEALPDPVGSAYGAELRPNGLAVARVRVPLGVILVIYEARPHVTVNAGALCLKAGNAAILRGGSEAAQCNALLGEMWRKSLEEADLPAQAIQVISGSHEEVTELLHLNDLIDLVIPRGGRGLIEAVSSQSRIPVLKHAAGVCHIYVGERADTKKALNIVLDSKLLMPAVCNAAETVLVDASMRSWLPILVSALIDNGVEVRGCPIVCEDVPTVEPATEQDWSTEYLDAVYSIRVVDGLDSAIEHIARYGSGHTDVIVTEDYSRARRFVREVDSAVVLVNASTMFCDGATLGMGAEIGISTDRLHARGPMGLGELTSYKFVIEGDGQVMGTPEDWRRAATE